MDRKYISRVMMNDDIPADSYLNDLPVVRYLAEKGKLELDSDVTFFVGENGTGKSTLLEGIAAAFGFNPEGGTKNFSFSTSSTHSELYKHLTLIKSKHPKDGFFLRAESFYNVATNIDELDSVAASAPSVISSYGGVSLHRQSHGESFLSLVQNRFGGNGLYILDEPEAALSPARLFTLIAEMDRLVKTESQLIVATHSPILMAFPGACICQLTDSGIERVGYEETEHYQLTRRFLDNPQKMLRYLLG